MAIPADNQLIPYYRGHRRFAPYLTGSWRTQTLLPDFDLERYELTLLPFHAAYSNRPAASDPAYDSSRRLVVTKISQVGLLIDIYA